MFFSNPPNSHHPTAHETSRCRTMIQGTPLRARERSGGWPLSSRAYGPGHVGSAFVATLLLVGLAKPSMAGTLPDALVKAYQSNPQLNADRARQRGADENVPQALAGYRPQVVASLSAGL
jgi:outer membrane protein